MLIMFFFTPQERRAVIFMSVVFLAGVCGDIFFKLYPPGYARLTILDVPPAASHPRVDVNRATYEELVTVPGIGPSTAARILYAREKQGRFSSLEELRGIKGFSKKSFARAAKRLIVGAP
jgi:competence ComEA-like helix-hairpin-helix protein